ncbi:hypothetical protein Syun_018712 [Stephania yunnanensis]|uniref:Uncharacterized protein n=1 Tax=Stephania yunnanensis TaxID=152371 RepID=A0AAP0ITW2_9MAGN
MLAKHQRRRKELTQTTPDQPLDNEAVYYKVASDCPKGCVYSLRSLWRKKRRYVDPNASTSQWSQLRSSLISCHSSVLPCRGPPCSVPRSPAAGPLSSLLSCSSSFLRRCYLLCVSASGAAAPSLAAAAHSFLPFWSISTELLPVYIDALELPCMLTGLLSHDPYAPYPCIPAETDAENILCVGFGKETMGILRKLFPTPFIQRLEAKLFAHDRLQRRRLELTQATPDQPVDDEAVYLNVAGECPKGRVYSLGSLRRNKKRYADLGASTSQKQEMVPRAEFDIVADQLRKVMAFMHHQFRMTMDGAGLSQPQPPPPPLPPPPYPDQQQPPQIDSADPPQQGDNVEREAQKWRNYDEHLGDTYVPSAWRPVLEDPSNLQIFFYYYAITFSLISREDRSVSYFVLNLTAVKELLRSMDLIGSEILLVQLFICSA